MGMHQEIKKGWFYHWKRRSSTIRTRLFGSSPPRSSPARPPGWSGRWSWTRRPFTRREADSLRTTAFCTRPPGRSPSPTSMKGTVRWSTPAPLRWRRAPWSRESWTGTAALTTCSSTPGNTSSAAFSAACMTATMWASTWGRKPSPSTTTRTLPGSRPWRRSGWQTRPSGRTGRPKSPIPPPRSWRPWSTGARRSSPGRSALWNFRRRTAVPAAVPTWSGRGRWVLSRYSPARSSGRGSGWKSSAEAGPFGISPGPTIRPGPWASGSA